MTDFDVREKRFEEDIETSLTTTGGYSKGNPKAFDRKLGLDVATFLSFIKTSQPKEWQRFEKVYGGDSDKQIIDRFCREVSLVGLLKILRSGFIDRGIKFRPVFWKSETGLNERTLKQYEDNIFHCTRHVETIVLLQRGNL